MQNLWNDILPWIEKNPEWIAIFVYALVELFIGSTKRTKANSVLALIWVVAKKVLRKK